MEKNDIMFLKLPFDIIPIIEILKKNDWIVSNFDTEISNIYNPTNYLYNKHIENVDYNLVIDRNIFHYIINSKIKSNECHKTAIALIIFCQVSEILIEPNLAVYEKINYNGTIENEAIDELKQFYEIDDTFNNSLYDFATGEIDKIQIDKTKRIDKNYYKEQLLKYNRLTEWQSMYLYILKMVSLFYDDSDKKIKLIEYSKWMIKFYKKSLPAFVYSTFLFSNSLPKKIMKYDKKLSNLEKKKQLYNMTWDLYFMNMFIRKWQDKKNTQEFLFASNDNIIKTLLPIIIKIIKNECNINFLQNYFSNKKDYQNLIKAQNIMMKSGKDRIYASNKWTSEYRDELIKILENDLL